MFESIFNPFFSYARITIDRKETILFIRTTITNFKKQNVKTTSEWFYPNTILMKNYIFLYIKNCTVSTKTKK